MKVCLLPLISNICWLLSDNNENIAGRSSIGDTQCDSDKENNGEYMYSICLQLLYVGNIISGLDSVKLPPKMRKRGRPKGAEKTVIGLPNKKRKLNKPITFLKKPPVDREKGMWPLTAFLTIN